MGGQEHRYAASLQGLNQGPNLIACFNIQPCGGLIQDHNLRIVYQGDRNAQAPLHTAAEGLNDTIRAITEVDSSQTGRDVSRSFFRFQTINSTKEIKIFGTAQAAVEQILLGRNP